MRTYRYITDYLPVRYAADQVQIAQRQTCYDFKDGILANSVKNEFITTAKSITNGDSSGWVICFIPASTHEKTSRRYAKLANALRQQGFVVAENAITNAYDTESGHLSGKSEDPIASFEFSRNAFVGKKVILIDDIITRGTTFNKTADKLESMGAVCVTGLFLAKTINPDYVGYSSGMYEPDDEPYYDDYYEEETYDNYNGSYAQDVEGWSDQDINDVLDGDPDAYWNID